MFNLSFVSNFMHWFNGSYESRPVKTENNIQTDPAESAEPKTISKHDVHQVDWVRCTPFFAMHFMCLAVIWVGWSWVAVGVAAVLYFIRMFAITGFYHRYFSHKTFKTSRIAQFVLALVGNSAVQRGPLWWASHHRAHHAHSDDETDVHSPHQHTFMWSHMFWITSRENFATNMRAIPDLAKYRELRVLDEHDWLVPVALAVLMLGLGIGLNHWFPSLKTSGMQMLTWGFFISTIVLFHATCTINSLSHLFGNKRFGTTDQSRNNLWLAFLTLGEGWHNNHHYYPASTRQGFYWWEVDITFYMLWCMARLGIIWDLQPVPARIYEKAKEHSNQPERLKTK